MSVFSFFFLVSCFFSFSVPDRLRTKHTAFFHPVMKVCISFLIRATRQRRTVVLVSDLHQANKLLSSPLPPRALFPLVIHRNVDGSYCKLGFQRFRTHLTISYSVFAEKCCSVHRFLRQ